MVYKINVFSILLSGIENTQLALGFLFKGTVALELYLPLKWRVSQELFLPLKRTVLQEMYLPLKRTVSQEL